LALGVFSLGPGRCDKLGGGPQQINQRIYS
jgi:hypothetical protein